MSQHRYNPTPEDIGKRLDVFLAEKEGVSRSQTQKMIDSGRVLFDGKKPFKKGMTIDATSVIEVLAEEYVPDLPIPTIPIISETDTYIVVEKPAGVLVHPTEAGETGTLAHWIVAHDPSIAGVGESEIRPGIVHRLDKDTSGLLVIAKTQEMFLHLKDQFKQRTVDKEYYALVHGVIEQDLDTIDFKIDRGPDGRMVARPKIKEISLNTVDDIQEGKQAKTEFSVISRLPRHTFMRVKIFTGRMHQIRVHLFAYGHPVVGDTLYQNKKLLKKSEQPIDRLFLHAFRLGFTDLDGEAREFQVALPDELQNYMDTLVS